MTGWTVSRRDALRLGVSGSAAVGGLIVPAAYAEEEQEVGATEDLMREHGVLRRTLIAYREAATSLRTNTRAVDARALRDAADLFQNFGEKYHEKMLEEQYIFPAVKKAGGEAGAMVDVLIAQHRRGDEITAYIHAATVEDKIDPNHKEALAAILEEMARMYEAHAAREDTVIFPAWKAALGEDALKEMGERFEEIEHQQFGEDGFEQAVEKIARIETSLGIADLSSFTASKPSN